MTTATFIRWHRTSCGAPYAFWNWSCPVCKHVNEVWGTLGNQACADCGVIVYVQRGEIPEEEE